MAVQGNVMPFWEMYTSSLFEGLGVHHHAKAIAIDLVANEAHHHASLLTVAVWFGHEHGLPRQFARNVLFLPLEDFVGVVILLRQPQGAIVINDAKAVLVPDHVNLGVDLGLIEAIVWPASPRAGTGGQVQAEAPDFSSTPTPILHIAGASLPQRKPNWWFVVADHVKEDDITAIVSLLKGINNVEEEQGVCLKDGRVLTCFPVNETDERWPLRLPGIVVVQVSLVLARQKPLAFGIEHAVPVERVRNLHHDNVLLRQGNGVDW
mmetsp:Transcript_71764/g.165972  ORF Transcript_71764/g.165972 Transcript_71764/m.165972 type:complete len:264 (-) Transcript_71764:1226-2017(-)